MTGVTKKRSRYDLPDIYSNGSAEAPAPVAQPAPFAPAPAAAAPVAPLMLDPSTEARALLMHARAEMARVMEQNLAAVERAMLGRSEDLGQKLIEAQSELQRVRAETAAMQNDPMHQVLRDLRAQLSTVG